VFASDRVAIPWNRVRHHSSEAGAAALGRVIFGGRVAIAAVDARLYRLAEGARELVAQRADESFFEISGLLREADCCGGLSRLSAAYGWFCGSRSRSVLCTVTVSWAELQPLVC
jgi:hypothetical protein